MPLREDVVRLRHMLDAAREAISFAAGRRYEDLQTDRQLTLSLVRSLEVIGEAANKVSADLQRENEQVPWPDVIGMRNRLIHAYFDVNLTVVWKTVTEELPELVAQLEELLAE
jgi:uncharacterized protein with HEPN domain